MKFGTGECMENCGAITVFFYVGCSCSEHLARRPACVPAHNPIITVWIFVGAQYVSNGSCRVDCNLPFLTFHFCMFYIIQDKEKQWH
jgi:hypothetical protein